MHNATRHVASKPSGESIFIVVRVALPFEERYFVTRVAWTTRWFGQCGMGIAVETLHLRFYATCIPRRKHLVNNIQETGDGDAQQHPV